MIMFTFVELPPFSALRDELFPDDELVLLQCHLAAHPEAGAVIPGTKGCRKLRWAAKGKGKRGGARVIYFLRLDAGLVVLVAAYSKGERDDVPRPWLRKLKEDFDAQPS